MEQICESGKINNSFQGNKTKDNHKFQENIKSDELESSSFIMDTTAENHIFGKEKSEFKGKIAGFDDIKIPSFLNDFKINKNVNIDINDYNKMKAEFGSPELAKLYLVDINKLYGSKKKMFEDSY